MSADDVALELQELIAALDRRLPRVEQAGEAAIASEAAALRARAVTRLAELSRLESARTDRRGITPADRDEATESAFGPREARPDPSGSGRFD